MANVSRGIVETETGSTTSDNTKVTSLSSYYDEARKKSMEGIQSSSVSTPTGNTTSGSTTTTSLYNYYDEARAQSMTNVQGGTVNTQTGSTTSVSNYTTPQNNYYNQASNQSMINTTGVTSYQNNNYNTNQQYGVPSNNFNTPGVYKVNNGQVYQVNNGMMNNNVPPKKGSGLKILVFLAIVVFAIVGLYFILNKDKEEKKEIDKNRKIDYDRTIMIYMIGSNLESQGGIATADLNGLDYNKLQSQNTKVLLIAGGTEKWFNSFIDGNSTSIYELKDTGFVKVKEQSKRNMGDASTLTDFLDYGYQNYASKKYDLIFWNHGGAIDGSEYDDLYAKDNLKADELGKAFNKSYFGKDNKLELIIFRTCLNGSVEIASTLKDYSDYMVASEEVTMGYSWGSLFTTLNNISKEDGAKEFGKKFIDGYMTYIDAYTGRSYGSNRVYSVYALIDLSKITNLENSINDFFSSIDLANNYNTVASVRSRLYQYGDSEPAYDMVDLYNLVDNLKYLSSDKGNKVLTNLSQAVVYIRTPDNRSKGLSIYFPYNGESQYKTYFLNQYSTFKGLSKYNAFISSFNSKQSGSFTSLSFADNKINVSKTGESADFELELTDEQKENYAYAGIRVFRDNKDGTYLPVYSGPSVELDGNTLKANVKGKQLKMVEKSTNESEIITLIEKEDTDDYIRYETYSVLEYISPNSDEFLDTFKMNSAKTSIIYDKKTKKISLAELKVKPVNEKEKEKKEAEETGKIVPIDNYTVLAKLEDYTHIIFGSSSYKILDANGNYTNDWESNGVFKGIEAKVDDFEFALEDYSDKYDYYGIFKIYDTHNNVYYSKLIKMK
jgi:hypothetical protein